MKNTYYFQHDYSARNDDKILELRSRYGNEGYAVFFYCLETMAERGDGFIDNSTMGGLSLGYGVTKEWLETFLNYCVELKLFLQNDKGFYNSRMIEHLKLRKSLSLQGKNGAKKRWGSYSPPIANPMQRKGKERKGNTNTKTKKKDSETSSPEEEFNFKREIDKLLDSKSKTYNIVGHYITEKGFKFENKTQFVPFLLRNLKSAKLLNGYDSRQITKAFDYCKKKWPDDWTLETVVKWIAEANKNG